MSPTVVETKDAKNKPIRRWYRIVMTFFGLLRAAVNGKCSVNGRPAWWARLCIGRGDAP
jgi:hypothetical protein